MTSYDKKNINKNKYLYKEGNNLISPLNSNQPKSLNINIFSDLNNQKQVNFPNINPKFNKLTPVIQNKKNTNNSHGKNNIIEISKVFSFSKEKNENKINKIMNSKYKLSKVVSNDLSSRINESKILDIYNNTKNTTKVSPLNSFKMETNSTYDNINIFKDSIKINNKSINGLRNLDNNNRNINENYSYNNNINNEISSNNSNIATKRETIGKLYVNTDISEIGLNTPKNNNNFKLVLPNKNIFDKKLVINCKNNNNNYLLDTPLETFNKNNQILLTNTTPENKLKNAFNEGNQNKMKEEIKLKIKKQKDNGRNNNNINTIKPSKNEHLIIESIGNAHNFDSKLINRKFTIDSNKLNKDYLKQAKKNKLYKCPEELHFYYISVLQEGKKNEFEFEGE